ncbi:Uncharacterised protein [Klebsiella pneumoniae]|nr:Uncharacterised protein [Klebsiella pneumoniae]
MVPDVIGSVQTQLKRNEEQQDDNSFLQLGQILFQGFQYKIQSTQAQYCEHHGAIDNQRFTTDCNNCRDRVEGKHYVREFHYSHT